MNNTTFPTSLPILTRCAWATTEFKGTIPEKIIAASIGSTCFLLAIFSVVGNGIFLLVFLRNRELRKPSNILLAFLASSDLAAGVISQPIFGYLTLLDFYSMQKHCLIIAFVRNFGNIIGGISVISLAAISVDRSLVFCIPFKYRSNVEALEKMYYVFMGFTIILWGGFTALSKEGVLDQAVFFAVSTGILASSFLIIIISYLTIYIVLKLNSNKISQTSSSSNSAINCRPANGSKLLALVAVFFGCYTPRFIFMISEKLLGESIFSEYIDQTVAVIFVLMKSSFNPFIYSLRMNDVKAAVKKMFPCAQLRNAIEARVPATVAN